MYFGKKVILFFFHVCLDINRSAAIPPPALYEPKHDLVTPSRYQEPGFGFDVKSNMKAIKMTPGPGEHLQIDYGVRITSNNHMLLA